MKNYQRILTRIFCVLMERNNRSLRKENCQRIITCIFYTLMELGVAKFANTTLTWCHQGKEGFATFCGKDTKIALSLKMNT